MVWLFSFLASNVMCVCMRNLRTSVCSFFPGEGNHVLYIGIIRFKTHRAASSNLSHRLRERVGAFIQSSMSGSYHYQTGCRWCLSHKQWDYKTGVAFTYVCLAFCWEEIESLGNNACSSLFIWENGTHPSLVFSLPF